MTCPNNPLARAAVQPGRLPQGSCNGRYAMGEIESKVTAHYTPGDLHGRILAGLEAAGRDVDALQPDDLKPFESLHLGGWQATEHVVDQLGVGRGARVLDVGCGIGGTARTLAAQRGAAVTGPSAWSWPAGSPTAAPSSG